MYRGTLYGQWEAIVTFQQFIVLSDADGIVDYTPPAIASITSIPLEIIQKGIEVLSKPDPYSRTPDCEGRRIELIDAHRPWGWVIVNHSKYQRLQDSDTVRAQTKERVRKHRELKRTVTDGNGEKRHTDTDTDTDTTTETDRAQQQRSRGSRLPSDWKPSELLEAWAVRERPDLDIPSVSAKFRDYWLAVPGHRGSKLDWEATYRNFIRSEKQGPKPKPSEIPKMKLCSYCEKVANGAVGGIWSCRDHMDDAMDRKPRPHMMGVVAKPVAGAD